MVPKTDWFIFLSDLQFAALYSAFITLEKDGEHTNPLIAAEIDHLFSLMEAEAKRRWPNDGDFTAVDPYEEDNGFNFH